MGLTHIVCPSDGQLYPLAVCRACARAHTATNPGGAPHCHLPDALIAGVTAPPDLDRQQAGISVTQLVGCQRQTWMQRAWPYAVDPEQQWKALHGTAVHDWLDAQDVNLDPVDAVRERRIFVERRGVVISGKFDRYLPGQGRIEDYKVKAQPFTVAPDEYVWQLNCYRWLLETGGWWLDGEQRVPYQAPQPIMQLVLYSLSHTGVTAVEVPVKPLSEVAAFIDAGLAALTAQHVQTVPRHYPDPQHTTFCRAVCTFRVNCLVAGP